MVHRLPLVFVHGNGIPRPVYQKMLIGLSHRFIATGIDRRGHDPAVPVTAPWPRLIDQLRTHILAIGEPVTLLGHGTGGWLSLLAAYRIPELVSAVLMLDSPLPTPLQARALAVMKRAGLARLPGRIGGAGMDLQALDPHCQALYRRFDCRPGDATYPDGLAALAAKGAPIDGSGRIVPCGMLVGEHSRIALLCGLRGSRRLVGSHLVRIEGSHFFPLERPLVTAKEAVRLHDRMVRPEPAGEPALQAMSASARSSRRLQPI